MALAPAIAAPGYNGDAERMAKCNPGQLQYSARLDRSTLGCYYKCNCYCASQPLVQSTFLDVYTNGIMTNIPRGMCCCCKRDNGRFIYYDDPLFGAAPMAGGCCKPYPYFCPHSCNCCGETLVFKPGCIGCPTGSFHGAGLICPCFCPIDVIYGLEKGEGEVIAAKIAASKAAFHAAGERVPAPVVAGAVMQQAAPTGAV